MTAVQDMDCACSRQTHFLFIAGTDEINLRDFEVIKKLGCGMEVEYGGPSLKSEGRYVCSNKISYSTSLQ